MMKQLITYFIIMLAFASCISNESTDKRLLLADSLMNEQPDSAYSILKSINTQELSTKADNAFYALLYTQAMDKNFIDTTNDSLINIAVDFYTNSNQIREKFRSYYYLGRIKYNNRDYFNALYAFTEAEILVDDVNDNYLSGLLFTQIGNIYFENFDYDKSLEFYKRALNNYKEASLTIHSNYALFDIALSYWNLMDNKNSETFFLECLKNAQKSKDDTLIRSCLGNLAVLYIESKNNEKARQTYDQIIEKGFSIDSCNGLIGLVYLNILNDNLDNIDNLISKAWSYTYDKNDTISLAFKCAKIEKRLGNFGKALEYTEIALTKQNSIIRETLRQPVLTVQKDLYFNESVIAKLENKQNKIMFIIVSCFVIFIVFLLYLYHRKSIKLKNVEINHFLDKLRELLENLTLKDNELTELNRKIVGLNDEIRTEKNRISEMNIVIQELFKSKFDYIEKIGCTIYERKNTNLEKEALYNKVKTIINDFSKDRKTLNDLECIINKYNNDIIKRIREDFPKVKESDIKLICYMFSGFSNRVISLFMNESVEYIAVRKSRLKNKILNKYNS